MCFVAKVSLFYSIAHCVTDKSRDLTGVFRLLLLFGGSNLDGKLPLDTTQLNRVYKVSELVV